MNTLNIVMTLTSLIGTVSTIFFAYLAFRRSEKEEEKKEVQIETTMISDIGYIKEGIKRVEKNISRLEEKYGDIDSLSLYTLRYKDNRMSGTQNPASDFYVIMNKNAFEVGNKVKLVKDENNYYVLVIDNADNLYIIDAN